VSTHFGTCFIQTPRLQAAKRLVKPAEAQKQNYLDEHSHPWSLPS
jgi:hypothetical protein